MLREALKTLIFWRFTYPTASIALLHPQPECCRQTRMGRLFENTRRPGACCGRQFFESVSAINGVNARRRDIAKRRDFA